MSQRDVTAPPPTGTGLLTRVFVADAAKLVCRLQNIYTPSPPPPSRLYYTHICNGVVLYTLARTRKHSHNNTHIHNTLAHLHIHNNLADTLKHSHKHTRTHTQQSHTYTRTHTQHSCAHNTLARAHAPSSDSRDAVMPEA